MRAAGRSQRMVLALVSAVALVVPLGFSQSATATSASRQTDPVFTTNAELQPSLKPGLSETAGQSRAPGVVQRGGAERVLPMSLGTGSGNWCDALLPGPGGTKTNAVDLSEAHALTRFFATESAFGTSDLALADALTPDDSMSSGLSATLDTYADTLPDVCAAPASASALSIGSVQKIGHTALVTPGTGTLALPAGTQSVIVDLRSLPAGAATRQAAERAVGLALAQPVAGPLQNIRGHNGPADEVFFSPSVYQTFSHFENARPIAPAGVVDLDLVLLTGPTMSPEAAEIAATLRMARRAWIAGDSIASAVAEADWRGVGSGGVAVRTSVDFLAGPPTLATYHAQLARQDNPNDPTIVSHKRTITVPTGVKDLEVGVDGQSRTDLDLFLLYDFNNNGTFDFPQELIAYSANASADELVQLNGDIPPGNYQAWVHGYSVPAGTTRFSLDVRTQSAQPWPDVIPADLALGTPQTLAAAVAKKVPVPVSGPVARGGLVPIDPFGAVAPLATGPGELRAGLEVAHGTLRMFFPYFPVVGDGIDARLAECLALVEAWNGTDRLAAQRLLRRFGEVLHDGHQFVFDFGPQTFAGFLPAYAEVIDGRPVVRRSGDPLLVPGDAILAMNGRPMADILAEELSRTSAATDGYRYDIAMRYISRLAGPTELLLEDPNGTQRTVTVQPAPEPDPDVFDPIVTARPSGPLTDLGTPDLYYLNLNTYSSGPIEAVQASLADATARNSAGLVVDMRGYPGAVNHYEVAARLIRTPFQSPIFEPTVYLGPDVSFPAPSQYDLFPFPAPAWDGPIILLTGPHTVSAAENFSQMLRGAGRLVHIVGRPSAGTNGNLTGVQLPGGFAFSYTGMNLLNPDGSTFHGIGIAPDVPVVTTAADIRDGIDSDLLTAVSLLEN